MLRPHDEGIGYPDSMAISDAIIKKFPDRTDKHEKWISYMKDIEDVDTVGQLREISEEHFKTMKISAVLRTGLDEIRKSKTPSTKGISVISSPNFSSLYDIRVKLLVLGDSQVGKSSLLLRFVEDYFPQNITSTVGVDFNVGMFIFRERELTSKDTAGHERFRTITSSYYRGSQGIMLVFDVSNRTSFENITEWIEEIKRHCNESISIVLVGNKIDAQNREVFHKEATTLANRLRVPYFETSAKNAIQVEQAFIGLVNEVIDRKTYQVRETIGAVAESNSWKCC